MLSTEDPAHGIITPASHWECCPPALLLPGRAFSSRPGLCLCTCTMSPVLLRCPQEAETSVPRARRGWDPGPRRCRDPVMGLLLPGGLQRHPARALLQ